MAVSSKGGGGGGGRGRPYGVMLLLAFGAAVLGVMVLHKLRERRIFTLLIQDKDNDLITLHLLLQREKEISKEMKKKIEDLKVKVNFLRLQKTELSNKFVNIQSVTSSLREEVTALESTVEEKQGEIKMLKEKGNGIDLSSDNNSQVSALREILKQKEAEIEEMKRVIERSTLSVTTDDPSNAVVKARVKELDSEKNTNLEDGKGRNVTNLEDGKDVGEGRNVGEGVVLKMEVGEGKIDGKDNGSNGENAKGVEVGESKNVLKMRKARVTGRFKGIREGRRKIISKEIGGSGNGGGESGVVRRGGEMNRFRVEKDGEILGERNGRVYEHSKDEGLRSSSKENDSGEVKGREKEAVVLNEKRYATSEERQGVNEGSDEENRLKAQNGVSSVEDSTTSTGNATHVSNSNSSAAGVGVIEASHKEE